jgi:hypothetical protein
MERHLLSDHNLMTKLPALFLYSLTASAGAATITTDPSNNGTGGIFFTMTPVAESLELNGFSTYFGSAAGSAVTIEVWTRTGAYAGFTGSSTGWTLVETVSGTSAGTATESALISLTTPIPLLLGQDTSIYLHGITAGGALRYFGTGTTSTSNYANADVTLFTDTARTGTVPFGGTQFIPRAFAGTLSYNTVPEPGTVVFLGLGALGLLQRRSKARAGVV